MVKTCLLHLEDHGALLKGDTYNILMDPKSLIKVIKIGKFLSLEESRLHYDLLHHYPDIFTWSYEDMPSIDASIMVHNVVLCHDTKPAKQKIHKINPKVALLVKIEI